MGLKDLFSRKKGDADEDDDDDFEADDFEDDGDSENDDTESDDFPADEGDDDPGFGGSSLDDGGDQDPDAMDDALGNDEIVTGGGPPDAEQVPDDMDDPEFEGEDPDFGADDQDYDEGEDEDEDADDDGGGLFSNPLVLYSAIGAGVLLILVAVGIGGWMFISGGDEEVAEQNTEEISNAIALPPPSSGGSGGLNDLLGADDKPPESETSTTQAPESAIPTGAETLSSVQSAGGLNALAGGGLNSLTTGGSTAAGLVIQASTMAAFDTFVDHPTPDPLPRAPDPDFLETREEEGIALPRVAVDGRLPWEFYSRPSAVEPDKRRVAILVTDLGLSQAATLSAIRKLPPAVTLSFSPYADDLDQWLLRSRRAGHEVVLGLPLESSRFPIEDPGPLALQTLLSGSENLTRLETIMASFHGYIGFEVIMGSKFTTSERHVKEMLDVLNSRGLMVLDGVWNNRSLIPTLAGELGMPRAFSDLRLDSVSALAAIDAKFKELDTTIITRNQAIATTTMSPAIMGRLKTWFQTLPGKNVQLVPVSALVSTQLTATDVEP